MLTRPALTDPHSNLLAENLRERENSKKSNSNGGNQRETSSLRSVSSHPCYHISLRAVAWVVKQTNKWKAQISKEKSNITLPGPNHVGMNDYALSGFLTPLKTKTNK
jgi:hypothetical protein